jgi:hypothetical protein
MQASEERLQRVSVEHWVISFRHADVHRELVV